MASAAPDADDIYIKSVFDKYRGPKPKLGPEELRELCYDLGFYFSDEEVASTVGIIIAFRIDKEDKSRLTEVATIGEQEFVKFWKKNSHKFLGMSGPGAENLRSAMHMFRKYDPENLGYILKENYAKLCHDLGQVHSNEEALLHSLSFLDQDGDGKISFNEFTKWLQWPIWKGE